MRRQIGCKRFFHEHRLAECELMVRDLRLQVRRYRDRHGRDGVVLDQHAPIAVSARNIEAACQLCGTLCIGARQREHFAAYIGTECGEKEFATVISTVNHNAKIPI